MGRLLIQFPGTNTTKALSETLSKNVIIVDEDLHELRLHDGVTPGGHVIGGGGSTGSSYHPDLFDWKWADHILNDVQWLRADTFSWHTGNETTGVYPAAYKHLADDIDGKTLQSETIGSTTIQFYLADDGHKICPASEESNATAIYNATGIAWYYIIDTTNERFKLPRAKPLNGAIAGNGITLGLSYDGSSNAGLVSRNYDVLQSCSTAYGTSMGTTGQSGSGLRTDNRTVGITTDSTKSGIIAERDNTAQHKYLYFYVGEFTQTALENTAGVVTEDFNELNAHKVIAFQAPTAQNNYTWYRKYADGWVEQGGCINTGPDASYTVALPVAMADTNYVIFVSRVSVSSYKGDINAAWANTFNKTTTSFGTWGKYADYPIIHWQVSGMAAQ